MEKARATAARPATPPAIVAIDILSAGLIDYESELMKGKLAVSETLSIFPFVLQDTERFLSKLVLRAARLSISQSGNESCYSVQYD